MKNEKTKEILLAASDIFKNEVILTMINNSSLSEFILSLSFSDEQILALSSALEKAL